MNKRSLREYRCWLAMKSRCYSPSNIKGYYKKDNIQVCDRWKNSFENFMKDMGEIPGENYSIERIDVTKDYCPENCKWIPMNEQPINRRNCFFFTYNGETKNLKEWSRVLNINYDTLRGRVIRRNIPFEIAINQSNFDNRVNLNGELHTVTEWCEIKKLNSGDVFSRIHRGWSKEKALTYKTEEIKKEK